VPRRKYGVVIVEKPGRPTMTFVDVGGRFVDPVEQSKRIAGGERRRRIKASHPEDNARVN
jgi:hypothetical protein